MAKETSTVRLQLLAILDKKGPDGVIHELAQIAYAKRDAATDNKAEHDYWHKVGGIFADAQERLEHDID